MEAATAPADVDFDIMRELEAVLTGLAHKLDMPLTLRLDPDLSKAS
jgi:hypothetical protein